MSISWKQRLATGKAPRSFPGRCDRKTVSNLHSHRHRARPDLIKMDIEGGETAALHGSVKILAERHAVWFIALHDLA